jgi:hypothetical protein
MSETIHGACLCGQVTFDVHDPEGAGYCHCTRCQRWSGGPGLAEVQVDEANFEVKSGNELISKYTEEGFSGFAFCSNCGSSLYAFGDGKVYVAAGALKDLAFEPAYHMMVAYKAPWDVITGDAPQHDEFPPGD